MGPCTLLNINAAILKIVLDLTTKLTVMDTETGDVNSVLGFGAEY